MNTDRVIDSLKEFCIKSSGNSTGQEWYGKSGTYTWNLGRSSSNGVLNGVVRKLAGIDATGLQIWVVAGSFKILPSGEIVRFTGLSKKDWKLIQSMAQEENQEVDIIA